MRQRRVRGVEQAEDVEVVFESTGDPLFNLIRNRSAVSLFGNRLGG